MLYRMLYSSQAKQPMTSVELEAILDDARRGNIERGITGVLVYKDGVFLQILEGERGEVEEVMRNIASDSRHGGVKTFFADVALARSFESWHMAYLSPSAEELARWASLEGTVSIDTLVSHVEEDPERFPRILVSIVDALAADGATATGAD